MKVLVVEDQLQNAELLCIRLKTLSCQVTLAASFEEGLDCLNRTRPDLVLLDLKLDERMAAGLEFLVHLRLDADFAQTPVYIHSVYVAGQSDLPQIQALADGYLRKPFRFQELKDIVEAVARSGRSVHDAARGSLEERP